MFKKFKESCSSFFPFLLSESEGFGFEGCHNIFLLLSCDWCYDWQVYNFPISDCGGIKGVILFAFFWVWVREVFSLIEGAVWVWGISHYNYDVKQLFIFKWELIILKQRSILFLWDSCWYGLKEVFWLDQWIINFEGVLVGLVWSCRRIRINLNYEQKIRKGANYKLELQ